jgi:hypothetical protein
MRVCVQNAPPRPLGARCHPGSPAAPSLDGAFVLRRRLTIAKPPITASRKLEGSGVPTGAGARDPEIKLSRPTIGAKKLGMKHPPLLLVHSGPPVYPSRVLTGRKRLRMGKRKLLPISISRPDGSGTNVTPLASVNSTLSGAVLEIFSGEQKREGIPCGDRPLLVTATARPRGEHYHSGIPFISMRLSNSFELKGSS